MPLNLNFFFVIYQRYRWYITKVSVDFKFENIFRFNLCVHYKMYYKEFWVNQIILIRADLNLKYELIKFASIYTIRYFTWNIFLTFLTVPSPRFWFWTFFLINIFSISKIFHFFHIIFWKKFFHQMVIYLNIFSRLSIDFLKLKKCTIIDNILVLFLMIYRLHYLEQGSGTFS